MRGRTRRRFPQTTSAPPEAYGDALQDVDTDRGATLRGELVRSFDCAAPDRTGLIDSATYAPQVGAAGAECARSHCRRRARSSRLAERVARCWRTPRADLACDVRRPTNRRHRMTLQTNLGDADQSRRRGRDQV